MGTAKEHFMKNDEASKKVTEFFEGKTIDEIKVEEASSITIYFKDASRLELNSYTNHMNVSSWLEIQCARIMLDDITIEE